MLESQSIFSCWRSMWQKLPLWCPYAVVAVPGFQVTRTQTVCPMFVQAWIEMASAYVKRLDPNHLVYAATIGYFGATTPSL